LISKIKTISFRSSAGKRSVLRQVLGAILFAATCSCQTYQPFEYFTPLSSAFIDNTGKRWVTAPFPGPGPHAPPGPGLLAFSASDPVDADEYRPASQPFPLTPLTDGSFRTASDIEVRVSDGTILMTDFYFPAAQESYPVILERTPNDRKMPRFSEKLGPLFARNGFIYVVQSVRGLNGSGGTFYPFRNEADDGRDMHKWIAGQPWFSSGRLGAVGKEYGAYAALLAAPHSPMLKAMIVENCSSDLFMNGGFYLDGVPMTGCLYSEVTWRLQDSPATIGNLRWDDSLFHLPLREMDDILGHLLFFWDDCLLHPSYDYYWEELSLFGLYDRIDTAVLHIGGWHSQKDLGGTVSNFIAMSEADALRGRSGRQSLLIGPWSNGINSESSLGFCDFTKNCFIDENARFTGWFAKWLKDDASAKGLPDSLVQVFCTGSNEWKALADWPVEGVVYEPYFLHSNGDANESWDDGSLTFSHPEGFEEIDSFLSDPDDPVLSELELGTDDQRPVERRDDVLTYTSSVLTEDIVIIGSPQVVLHMNTTVPDTDLFVMLTDVDEYGFSRPVSQGVRRVRFHNSFQTPSAISPSDINEYILDLTPCANRFLAGHSIRLNIMGSYFPFITRNQNTGSSIGQDSETRSAPVFILHDFDYPSRLVLPVADPTAWDTEGIKE